MNTSPLTTDATSDLQRTIREMQRVFTLQRAHRPIVRNTDAAARRRKLQVLKEWMLAHRPDIRDALYRDFRKPALEVDATEIYAIKKEIEFAQRHLARWMRPKTVPTPLTMLGARSRVTYEPRGVSLIMAPWNYPFYLVVSPLVSAIAAGCPAMVKPSELTPHTAALVHRMLSELFPENEVAVFEGDADVAGALLGLGFDHIFFTGSPAVGKIVMKAAAQHLTSVTLELGGKSPAIVDETADVADAAEKLVWGKFLNNGQTCVAPDYLLVQRTVYQPLVEALKNTIRRYYAPGGEVADSPDYGRIVNARHHQRLTQLLRTAVEAGAEVVAGGQSSDGDCYLAPTLLTNVNDGMAVMQQEIFGPILPIIPYATREEAIAYVNNGDKPLALYIFSQDSAKADYVLEHTSSGGAGVNECVAHLNNPHLPFGGINQSGLGSAHGYYGFRAFSHEKAVLKQRVGFTVLKFLYPPYTGSVQRMMDWTMKWF
ncbi:MAG: aldehyde dehydrogenase family protein [Ferruginibacter sp.]|nr:aldehyde dehydrogenase family protein [Cytophagales bacterium]